MHNGDPVGAYAYSAMRRFIKLLTWPRMAVCVGLATIAVAALAGLWLWIAEPAPDRFKGHTGRITCIAYSPDGAIVATGSDDGNIGLWLTDSYVRTGPLLTHGSPITSITWSPTEMLLAASDISGTVILWDFSTFGRIRTICLPPAPPSLSCQQGSPVGVFSPDGRILVTGGGDCIVRMWDVRTGEELHTLDHGGSNTICSLAFSSDGNLLASMSKNGVVRLWRQPGNVQLPLEDSTTPWPYDTFSLITITPDGERLIRAGAGPSISIWDINLGTMQPGLGDAPISGITFGRAVVTDDCVHSSALAPDGDMLAIAVGDGTLRLWDITKREKRSRARIGATALAFPPDGGRLAVGDVHGTVRVYALENFLSD